MPRKHVNLKIGKNKFQLSVLDPFFHRSYNQAWTPSERNPLLVAGEEWKATDLPLDLTRAMDQAVLACSTLSKKIALDSYPQIKAIIIHISRNDVTYMLELNDDSTKNETLLQYTWDQNAQLVPPDNFKDLGKLGLSPSCQKNLEEDLTQCSFGRLGLFARFIRLMSTKSHNPSATPQLHLSSTHTA
jgi:hypothetical protein